MTILNPNRWVYRWPWTRVMMLTYCLTCTFVGVLGFGDRPAASIQSYLGDWAVSLYSGTLIIFGLLGALGIFRNLQITVIAVWAIAGATFCHGLSAWAEGNPQTGLRLIAAPLMMVPLVWSWRQWLVMVKHADRLELPHRREHK